MREGYKESSVGVIPIDWEVKKLGECLNNYQNGYAFSSKDYSKEGVPILTMACIGLDGNFQYNPNKSNYWNKPLAESMKQFLINKNDILISMTDVTPQKNLIGRMVEVAMNQRFLLNQRVGRLDTNESQLNKRYLKYLSNGLYWRSHSKAIASLGVQANIGTEDIKKSKIPLPPLQEQKKIADILTTVDDKINSIQTQIEQAQELKKGLMQKLFSEGIGHTEFKDSTVGRIPKSWEVKKLGDVCEKMTNGFVGTASPYYCSKSEGVFYFQSNNIRENTFDYRTKIFITKEFDEKQAKSQLKSGDLLTVQSGHIGTTAVVSEIEEGSNCHALIITRPMNTKLNSIFSCQLLNYYKSNGRMKPIFVGSTIKHINVKDLNKFSIPIPPLQEQQKIADILTTADDKITNLKDKKNEYQELKKGLMQKLLTGEIRVNVEELQEV